MLREMRDAVGDSGEFYTLRAVVRFLVAVTECLRTAKNYASRPQAASFVK
jgi:hypothetical protein